MHNYNILFDCPPLVSYWKWMLLIFFFYLIFWLFCFCVPLKLEFVVDCASQVNNFVIMFFEFIDGFCYYNKYLYNLSVWTTRKPVRNTTTRCCLVRWGLGRPCESVVKWSELICDAARGFRVAFLTRDTKLEHSRDSHTMLLSIPIAYMSKWQDIELNLSTRSESYRRGVELNCKWDRNNVDLKCQTQRVRNIIIAITQSTLKWFYITTMYTRYTSSAASQRNHKNRGNFCCCGCWSSCLTSNQKIKMQHQQTVETSSREELRMTIKRLIILNRRRPWTTITNNKQWAVFLDWVSAAPNW